MSRAQSELAKRTNTVKLFAAAFLLSVAALIVLAIRQRGVPEFFPLPLLMGVIAFAYTWNYWGTKRALSEALLAGKSDPVSPGHVVRVIARGKHSYNESNYEFQVPGGPLIRKTERDHTRQIFEMEIPVFYDSASPEKRVALCATYYRLRDAEL